MAGKHARDTDRVRGPVALAHQKALAALERPVDIGDRDSRHSMGRAG